MTSALDTPRPLGQARRRPRTAFIASALLAGLLLGACHGSDDALAESFQASVAAAGNGGVVDLADLPTRPWDRFALIPGNASSDVIREATGLVVDTGQSTVSGGTVIELQPVGPSP